MLSETPWDKCDLRKKIERFPMNKVIKISIGLEDQCRSLKVSFSDETAKLLIPVNNELSVSFC